MLYVYGTHRLTEQRTNVSWHLVNLGGVELLNLSHHTDILGGDKVDGNTLSTETTTSTNSVDVVLLVSRQVVVNNQRDLLDIDTSGQQIGGDQNSRRTGSELVHNGVSLTLRQVSVNSRHSEVVLLQLSHQRLNLGSGVTEDDSLGDGNRVVQVTQTVELVLLLLNVDVVLLDTFQGQLVLLDQNTDRVVHELGGDLQHVLGHSGGQKNNLGGLWQQLEDVVDLLLETRRQHLIGLIQNEHLNLVGLEVSSVDHVEHSTRSTHDNLDTRSEGLDIVSHRGTTNRSVDGNLQVQTNVGDDVLDLQSQLSGWSQDQSLGSLLVDVNVLQSRNGEGGSLTGTRLGLGQHVSTFGDRQDGSLLNGRWRFVTVTENTSNDLWFKVQVVKGVHDVVVVGLDQAGVDFLDSVGHGGSKFY